MTTNKILIVDFVNKKVTGGHQGPSQQAFTVLRPPNLTSNKRVIDAIERIDTLMEQLRVLERRMEDKE